MFPSPFPSLSSPNRSRIPPRKMRPPPIHHHPLFSSFFLVIILMASLRCGAASGSSGGGGEGFCSAEPSSECSGGAAALLEDLPGFTRSVYKRDHALITPESHVFSPLPDWINTLGAYLISPALAAHFTMYLANMQDGSKSAPPPKDVERLVFVLHGSISLSGDWNYTFSLGTVPLRVTILI